MTEIDSNINSIDNNNSFSESTSDSTSSEYLIEVKNVKTHFYTEVGIVKAVEGVSFSIKKGEVLGLVGESGCGKSVTALSMLNLVRFPGIIENGQVLFNGMDLLSLDEKDIQKIRGDRITMIFQDPMSSLNPIFTVSEQIAEVILLHKNVSKLEAKNMAIDIMKKVGIPQAENRVDDYPHLFSGGMRQRIMIGRAIANNPDLLIADEPTTALDVTIQAQVLEIIKSLQHENHMSVLLITHNLGVVAEYCDRVAVMYGGYIVETAPVKDIFVNPAHPYTIALMLAIPRIDVKFDRLQTLPGSVPDLINPPTGCRFNPRCKFSTQRCIDEEPVLQEVEPNHFVACWEYKNVLSSEDRGKVKIEVDLKQNF